jgi:hypothetical protein
MGAQAQAGGFLSSLFSVGLQHGGCRRCQRFQGIAAQTEVSRGSACAGRAHIQNRNSGTVLSHLKQDCFLHLRPNIRPQHNQIKDQSCAAGFNVGEICSRGDEMAAWDKRLLNGIGGEISFRDHQDACHC